MNGVNILVGLKHTQIIVHPVFPLLYWLLCHGTKQDALSLEESWAGIFHMHKNVPENYSVIVYIILSGLESTAKAHVPCATSSRMLEMFLWGLEAGQRN